ncbi:hypothetical protein [Citrobacter freundii]|uniref:Uncharacterized protein n=1 Tax=Citrobacter freundii TaxID=546 RepID=A0A7G2IUW2_CITFR|nr:hypothetical protein [Citrobacter freundii]
MLLSIERNPLCVFIRQSGTRIAIAKESLVVNTAKFALSLPFYPHFFINVMRDHF